MTICSEAMLAAVTHPAAVSADTARPFFQALVRPAQQRVARPPGIHHRAAFHHGGTIHDMERSREPG